MLGVGVDSLLKGLSKCLLWITFGLCFGINFFIKIILKFFRYIYNEKQNNSYILNTANEIWNLKRKKKST